MTTDSALTFQSIFAVVISHTAKFKGKASKHLTSVKFQSDCSQIPVKRQSNSSHKISQRSYHRETKSYSLKITSREQQRITNQSNPHITTEK